MNALGCISCPACGETLEIGVERASLGAIAVSQQELDERQHLGEAARVKRWEGEPFVGRWNFAPDPDRSFSQSVGNRLVIVWLWVAWGIGAVGLTWAMVLR